MLNEGVQLGAKHIKLLRQIVADQEIVFASTKKALEDLHDAGFIFIRESDQSIFGDKSVTVRSALRGEEFLEEIDGSPDSE